MTFVYMLISLKNKKFISYVGWTNDLLKRLELHNQGKGAKFTRGRKWKLIYFEILSNKNKAIKREYKIKKDRKLRNFIKQNYLKYKNNA